MNASTLPSESQVISPSTAGRVGCSSRRWIGMMGKSCLMAQLSGMLWKSEKLQKYVSESMASMPSSSSGKVIESPASRWILREMAQYRFSAMQRCSSDR